MELNPRARGEQRQPSRQPMSEPTKQRQRQRMITSAIALAIYNPERILLTLPYRVMPILFKKESSSKSEK